MVEAKMIKPELKAEMKCTQLESYNQIGLFWFSFLYYLKM